MLAHGIPSSLLIMLAVTPIVLLASRLFYRYCEAPSILRAEQARGGRAAAAPGLGATAP